MEYLEIRYAAGHVERLTLPEGAADLTVQQYARALVHITDRRVTRGPVGTEDVAAAIRDCPGGFVAALTEGDEVRWKGRRVIVSAAQHGAVLFTSPEPVAPDPEFAVGAAAYPEVAATPPRTTPGDSAYPSVRDGRWG